VSEVEPNVVGSPFFLDKKGSKKSRPAPIGLKSIYVLVLHAHKAASQYWFPLVVSF
jgi:hypothetical protein